MQVDTNRKMVCWASTAISLLLLIPGATLFLIICNVDQHKTSPAMGLVWIFVQLMSVFVGLAAFSLIMNMAIRRRDKQSGELKDRGQPAVD